MFEWWSTLGRALQIFYGIAITTSALMLFQMVLMLFGMDGDSDFDVDDIDDHGGGGILSVRTITASFVGFGWTGGTLLESGWTLVPTILVSTVVGGVFLGSNTPRPSVNAAGDIAMTASLVDGRRIVLVSRVPEPSPLALGLATVATSIGLRRRRSEARRWAPSSRSSASGDSRMKGSVAARVLVE